MITIDNVLQVIDKIKSEEFQTAAKKIAGNVSGTIKDKTTSIMRHTGKVGELKHKLMLAYKSFDKINLSSMKEYADIAEKLSKNKRNATSAYKVAAVRLKMAKDTGKLTKKEYLKLISKLKRIHFDKITQFDSQYAQQIQAAVTKNRKLTKMVFNDIHGLKGSITGLKDQLKNAKAARSKNALIAVAVSIAVVSSIAVGVKIYSMVMKKLKSPCKDIKDKFEKTSCELYAEMDALKSQMVILKQQSVKCELAEDPAECNKKINDEIEKIKAKIAKHQTKLDNLDI